ncbi:hypothetical protein JST97_07555 [bacterium]|nr:hypothetical protein [bacterium]
MIPRNHSRSSCADKHDKLGWVAGFSFPVGDTIVGVRTNVQSMLETLRQSLPIEIQTFADAEEVGSLFSFRLGGQRPQKGQRDFHVVYRDWTRIERTHDLEKALQSFKMLALDSIHGNNPRIQLIYPGALVQLDGKNTVLLGEGYREVAEQLAQTQTVLSKEFVRFDVQGLVAPCPLQSEAGVPLELQPLDRVLRLSESEHSRVLTPGEAVVRTFSLARGTDNPGSLLSMLGHLFKKVMVKEVPRAELTGPQQIDRLFALATD